MSAGGSPEQLQQQYGAVQEAWQSASRSGQPRLVSLGYFRLGDETAQPAEAYLRDYYSFYGPVADRVVQEMLTTPEAIRERAQAYEAIGVDEMILSPTVAELHQIDRLADVVG